MSQPTCATCRYFLSLPSAEGVPAKHGLCRRFPAIPPRNKPDPADEWCGEHAPRPAEAGLPELPAPPPLPGGWTWSGERVVGPRGVEVFADDEGDLVIAGHWFAPIAVVEAAIAAHRARVGRAS